MCLLLSSSQIQHTNAGNNNSKHCSGYIESISIFRTAGIGPYPIECGNSIYGDRYGPKEYQESSCCSGDGRYFVQTGQVGGFDYEKGIADSTCSAYMDALAGLLCDPKQGDNIVNINSAPENVTNGNDTGATTTGDDATASTTHAVFRICKTTCDAVFEACGLPGKNIVLDSGDETAYTDGASLCEQLWGGFGHDNPCDKEPLGFPCQANLQLAIVDSDASSDNNDCLNIITPSSATISHYDIYNEAPSTCNEISTGAAIAAIVVLLLICLCCCGCCFVGCYYFVANTRGGGGGARRASSTNRYSHHSSQPHHTTSATGPVYPTNNHPYIMESASSSQSQPAATIELPEVGLPASNTPADGSLPMATAVAISD